MKWNTKYPILNARNRKEEESIVPNLAPMLDVVFLLLVFFVVNYTTTPERLLKINLPYADETLSKKEPALITLSIQSDGRYSFRGKAYQNTKNLAQVMQKSLKSSDTVMISADARVSYQRIITAFDILGQAGVSQIRLNTKQNQKEGS